MTSRSTPFISRRDAAIALVAVSFSLHATAKPFTCSELGAFVGGIAKFRDQGIPLSMAKQAVAEGGMSSDDKQRYTRLIGEIYAAPEISPAAWVSIAARTCIISRKSHK